MPNNVLLERVSVGASGASSVVFNSIPQTGYNDLKIVVSARDNRSGYAINNLVVNFNGTSTTYTGKQIYYANSGSASYGTSYNGSVPSPVDTANTFSNTEIYIPNYNVSGTQKSFLVDDVSEGASTYFELDIGVGLWNGTSSINSITLTASSASFVQYSTFSLYGISNEVTTPTVAPLASGGDIIQTDGTYWYHAFLNPVTTGYFTPTKSLACDVLIVAGGGGGSDAGGSTAYNAGGGGAGGVLGLSGITCNIGTSYAAVVGAGGAGSKASNSYVATAGGNSSFNGSTAIGGGKGGAPTAVGGNGGSGGGGGSGNGSAGPAGGAATSGQGYAGSAGTTYSGGGGGGAGGAGGQSQGGVGTSAYSAWGLATGTGHNVSGTVYYAGGAGGGYNTNSGTPGGGNLGGNGGGGRGGWSNSTTAFNASVQDAVAGTPNTGGGGGGAPALNNYPTGQFGADGGSGIIIVRYLV